MTPSTKVFISFPTTTPGLGNDFQLDDTTKGVLDSPLYTLGGGSEVSVDVTNDVRSVTVRRGRSFQLEQFQAGQANVVLSNNDRDFDPTNGLQTGTRTNLVPNPTFANDLNGWGTGTTYATTVASDNPIGWWRLNDASGAALNQTGSVDGSYKGSPTRLAGALARDGNSVGLNGSTQYVTLAAQANINNVITDDVSVEAWFICDDVSPTTPQVIWEEGATQNGLSLYVYGGELYGLMWESNVIKKRIQFPISSNVIYHVVFITTVIGPRCELYLNGVGVGIATVNTATALAVHTGANAIGSTFASARSHVSTTTTAGTWSFAGRLGDVARYNIALTASQVLQHYEAGITDLIVAGATAAYSGERGAYGATSAQITTTTTGEGFSAVLKSLEPLTSYRISGYVWVESGSGVRLTARDAVNGITSNTSSVATAREWTRLSTTITTGTATPDLLLAFVWDGAGVAYVDAVLVETGTTLDLYFDGSMADGRIVNASVAWTGTPDASSSSLTYSILGTGSPYFPSVRPRVPLAITVNGSAVFTGRVEDWDFDYNVSGDSVAVAKAADGYAELARTEILSLTASVEASGARIDRVLDLTEVNWPASLRAIDTGDVTLANASVSEFPINTLEYLRQVEQAEFGALYIGKDGVLNFNERTSSRAYTSVQFGDTSGIPFVEIQVAYGTELIKNRVTINRPGESLITVDDTDSITDYGVIAYDLADTLLEDDTQATDLATLLVERYAEPTLRITRIGVDLRAVTDAQVASLLDLELGDVVTVSFTPNGIGDPISQALIIDAIEHSVSVSQHRMTFDLSQTDPAFVLDSLVWGVLNDDKL